MKRERLDRAMEKTERSSVFAHWKKELGATMVEFVIAFPVLIFAFLGLFDFSRIILAKTILRNGASRAAELATVIPNLEAEDDVNHPERADLRKEALLAIYRRAIELPNSTGYKVTDEKVFARLIAFPDSERGALPANSQVSLPSNEPSLSAVKITLPNPAANVGEDINQVFQQAPIKIELNAEIHPFLPWMSPLRITERIEVYREPRNIATKPVLLNCQGDPKVPGETVQCPCPQAAASASPPKNMVLSRDQTSCVCKSTYTVDPGNSSCSCPATHFEATTSSGESYCACRLAACPMDPTRPNTSFDQNFDMKQCKCVDSPCPTGTIVREDGSCGGCNQQNCSALGSSYVADPAHDCGCKTCAQLFGANPPRNAIDGACVCANKAADKPKCTNKEIWSDQQCKCVGCGGHFFANSDHTACECNDNSVRERLSEIPAGWPACWGQEFWDAETCNCRQCIYGGYDNGAGIHVSEQPSSTDLVTVDGSTFAKSCECRPNSVGTPGGHCSCVDTHCPANQWFDTHYCTCRTCNPGTTFNGTNCVCDQVYTTPIPDICPAGKAFHGGGCWCYDCAGYANGYSTKASHGWTCDCLIQPSDCPANTHFVSANIAGCDCVPCTANDYQTNVPGCKCEVATSGCSPTQSVDSICQCHDCPPCQIRNPSDPTSCINPCLPATDRCPVNGLCCETGQETVVGPTGTVCVSPNSPCKANPFSASCSTQGCVNTPLGQACQLVVQE